MKRLEGQDRMRSWTLFFLSLFVLSGCMGVELGGGDGIPPLEDDLDRGSLERAIHQSLKFLEKIPPGRTVGEWPRKLTAREVRDSLLAFTGLLGLMDHPEKFRDEVLAHFDLFRSGDSGEAGVLFTGYYQPVIEGSLEETSAYRFPIYRKPDDLVEADLGGFVPGLQGERVVGRVDGGRFVPYFSRYEIDHLGRLRGKGWEIAWVKDPVDLFFLHVQGSGLLRLQDGRLLRLHYAASNGRPYTSVGKLLIHRGEIQAEGLSMRRLRRYLEEHPEERDRLFAENDRYIFFRFVREDALGSLGVPLTPGRSIATDARLFPRGALALIVTRRPVLDAEGNLVGWKPFSRFVLNQDTGSAVRGSGRVDLYFGSGPEAGEAAGYMKSRGRLYFLVKKKGPHGQPSRE